jgi:hypothetical protein
MVWKVEGGWGLDVDGAMLRGMPWWLRRISPSNWASAGSISELSVAMFWERGVPVAEVWPLPVGGEVMVWIGAEAGAGRSGFAGGTFFGACVSSGMRLSILGGKRGISGCRMVECKSRDTSVCGGRVEK